MPSDSSSDSSREDKAGGSARTKTTERPIGAAAMATPAATMATSTPKSSDEIWEQWEGNKFFTKEEWYARVKQISSLNPKEKELDRRAAIRKFKQLIEGQDTESKENVEATWRSLNKYLYHVAFSMDTTTNTREEQKQLKEMRRQVMRFEANFNIGTRYTSEDEDAILREELKFPRHIHVEEKPKVIPQRRPAKQSLQDWIIEVPEGQTTKSLFAMATNNFLRFYERQVEVHLAMDTIQEGFPNTVREMERSFTRIQKLFDTIEQTEEDQELMVFLGQKVNNVKDHLAILEQIEQEELQDKSDLEDEEEIELEEEIDAEINQIMHELNEFASSYNSTHVRWPHSELAYLICSWVRQGQNTQLNEEDGRELQSLLSSFGKERLKVTLHLWKTRLCETQSRAHKEISILLAEILEGWNLPEAEEDTSVWAGHTSRFTRGNLAKNSQREKFSIFMDPNDHEREEEGEEDATTPQRQLLAPRRTSRASHVPFGGGGGLRPSLTSGRHRTRSLSRNDRSGASRTAQETTVNVDQFERLLDLFERRTSGNSNNHSGLKLPPIKLEKFDGNPLEWVNWWPRYEAVIHKRKNLDDQEKLIFLQSYVTEKAAKELWGAKIETLPYDTAIKILKEKFADKELLTGVYRNQLLRVTLPKSPEDISGIRNFVDEVKKYMNCLREFKMLPQSYSISTMDFYRAHLPTKLIHCIVDQEGRRFSELSLGEFMKALTKYVKLREDISRFRQHVGSNDLNRSPTTTMATRTGKPTSKLTGSGSSTLPADFNYYKCLFCNKKGVGGHLMLDCPTVKDGKERFQIILKLSRCTNCLSPSHKFFECPSKKTCFCNKKHHTSLHDYFAQLAERRKEARGSNQNGSTQQGNPKPQGNNSSNRSQPSGN